MKMTSTKRKWPTIKTWDRKDPFAELDNRLDLEVLSNYLTRDRDKIIFDLFRKWFIAPEIAKELSLTCNRINQIFRRCILDIQCAIRDFQAQKSKAKDERLSADYFKNKLSLSQAILILEGEQKAQEKLLAFNQKRAELKAKRKAARISKKEETEKALTEKYAAMSARFNLPFHQRHNVPVVPPKSIRELAAMAQQRKKG